MCDLQPIFHPSSKLSYFFDTREIIRSATFQRLLALGLVGMSGSDATWRSTDAGHAVLAENPRYLKEAIVDLTFANPAESKRWRAAIRQE